MLLGRTLTVDWVVPREQYQSQKVKEIFEGTNNSSTVEEDKMETEETEEQNEDEEQDENGKDAEDGEESEEDEEDTESVEEEKPKPVNNDIKEGKTLFIR